jgi:hypothetical protein
MAYEPNCLQNQKQVESRRYLRHTLFHFSQVEDIFTFKKSSKTPAQLTRKYLTDCIYGLVSIYRALENALELKA